MSKYFLIKTGLLIEMSLYVTKNLKWSVSCAALVKKVAALAYWKPLNSWESDIAEDHKNLTKDRRSPTALPLRIFAALAATAACHIIKDSTHSFHELFALLLSGRSYKTIKTRTTRFRNRNLYLTARQTAKTELKPKGVSQPDWFDLHLLCKSYLFVNLLTSLCRMSAVWLQTPSQRLAT